MLEKIYRFFIGAPRNPLDTRTRRSIALTAFLAWIGLGADGLSSSCYGPEQAFLGLGVHTHLALYLALATAFTVCIISFAYNQVIELFPNGGGGYKVATTLVGRYAGLVVGAALVVDYILTIVISVASGADAVFSLLPFSAQHYKLEAETALIILLIIMNLRGVKESIKLLMPIFLGFVFFHLWLITYGIAYHHNLLPTIVKAAVVQTHTLAMQTSIFFVIALFLHAYSLGGGTYTGLEAVSNNVNKLSQPRVQTGKWTMLYMAVSLSVTAGGIILLYLLWHVTPEPGQTLNAIAFRSILEGWHYGGSILTLTLFFEAGLLFVSANTGFLGGPAVLANMAMDQWVPNRFRNLSSRLVTQNGILLFGIAGLIILYATRGRVPYLVVLYSINVFLAFAVSLYGLCKYWLKHRIKGTHWRRRLLLSVLGFIICSIILVVIVVSKFTSGGWVAVAIVGAVVVFCLFIRKHYMYVNRQLELIDKLLTPPINYPPLPTPLPFDNQAPTAVLFVGKSRGVAMHTLLWVQRLFPGHFRNFIFVSAGIVDVESYGGEKALANMQSQIETNLQYFVNFAQQHGLAARAMSGYGTDPVEKLVEMSEKIAKEFPDCLFFASQIVLNKDSWLARGLHNETAFSVQRKLHMQDIKLVILPVKLQEEV